MKKTIYILSGLGADERVFKNLDLDYFNVIHLNWIQPKFNESIDSYSARISDNIKHENPIVLGLSFGGIVAIEIARQIQTEKIILISSVKSKNELPPLFKLIGKLKLNRVLPISFLKYVNFITYWFFGITESEYKLLLKQIIKETDINYLKWSIDQILNWKNIDIIENIYHIHGNNDRIFPIKYIQNNQEVVDGGHFMILDKPKEIEVFLKEIV